MGFALWNRRLQLVRIVPFEIAAQLLGSGVTIWFAVDGAGVWSLAYGMIANSIFMLGAAYVIGGRPTAFSLHSEYRKKIINYGKWILIASLLGFVINRGDLIIFGMLVEKTTFGVYSVAVTWAMAMRALVGVGFNKLAYPIFSEISRERPKELTRIYNRIRDGADFCMMLIFLVAISLADPVLDQIYPKSFDNVGHYLGLLALYLLFIPYDILNTLILTSGDSKKFAMILAAPSIALFVLTPAVYNLFGFDSAIVCAMSVKALSLPMTWRAASKRISLGLVREARLLSFAAATVAFLVFTT